MKKTVLLLMAGTLVCGSIAMAAPAKLSSTQLDQVVAGQAVMDSIFGDNQIAPTDLSSLEVELEDNAVADNNGNANSGYLASAEGDGLAIAGNGNLVADVEINDINVALAGSVAASGTAQVSTTDIEVSEGGQYATDCGVNVKAEEGAQVALTGDNFDIEVSEGGQLAYGGANYDIEAEKDGVVATDSACVTQTDMEIDIEDSFNTDCATLDVSGQGGATGIVLANSLDEQNINAQLVLTNAASNMPTGFNAELIGIQIPAAVAISAVSQIGINDSFIGVEIVDFTAIPQAPLVY